MSKALIIFILLPLFISCRDNSPEPQDGAIARANDSYLYREDIAGLVPAGTSKADSVEIIRNYIDRWASRKLLLNAAEINLGDERKSEFDALVRRYQADLYTKAYIDEIVNRSADTIVSDEALEIFYKENKENFRTNGMLVRLRYIHLAKDNPQFGAIRSRFFDYRKSDKKFWDTYALQFKSFAMNDSVWVDMNQIYAKLPFITPDNRDRFIAPGKKIEHPDATDVYLVKIVNVIDQNKVSPFEYIKPILRDVIVNRRKLELIKKIEKEITDDAIKDNKYEIYK